VPQLTSFCFYTWIRKSFKCRISYILVRSLGNEVNDLISNGFLYFIVRVGNGVLAIATLSAFTRLLSPEEYGVYALGIAVATIASGVLFQWLNFAISRYYPPHPDDPSKVMGVVSLGFWVATAVAALVFIGLLPFLGVFGVESITGFVLFLITIYLGIYTLALQVANAESRPILYGQISWAKGGASLLAGCILIHYGVGERGALIGFLAGLMLAVVAFAPNLLFRLQLDSMDKRLAENMFRYSLPLAINNLATAAVDVADRFMIGKLLGVAKVAPYAVAYDLVQQSLGPMMNVLLLAAFPLIVQAFDSAQEETTRNRLHALGSNLLGLGLPVAAAVGFFAGDISEIILGKDYRQDAITIIPWLAAAIFIGAFKSFYLDVVFQLRSATKYLGYIAISMLSVNIVLNLILLPIHGAVAAAWATLAAFMVGALLSWVLGRSLFKLPNLGKDFLGSAVATTAMVVVLNLLPSSSGTIWLSFKISLAIITYALLAWALDVAGFRKLRKV
jgi:O-antigen/teichoic acid export membrane protein